VPVHEYVCRECGCVFSMFGTFEMFSSLSPVCPNCKSSNIRKKIFAPAIVFKGKGFYKTDEKEGEK